MPPIQGGINSGDAAYSQAKRPKTSENICGAECQADRFKACCGADFDDAFRFIDAHRQNNPDFGTKAERARWIFATAEMSNLLNDIEGRQDKRMTEEEGENMASLWKQGAIPFCNQSSNTLLFRRFCELVEANSQVPSVEIVFNKSLEAIEVNRNNGDPFNLALLLEQQPDIIFTFLGKPELFKMLAETSRLDYNNVYPHPDNGQSLLEVSIRRMDFMSAYLIATGLREIPEMAHDNTNLIDIIDLRVPGAWGLKCIIWDKMLSWSNDQKKQYGDTIFVDLLRKPHSVEATFHAAVHDSLGKLFDAGVDPNDHVQELENRSDNWTISFLKFEEKVKTMKLLLERLTAGNLRQVLNYRFFCGMLDYVQLERWYARFASPGSKQDALCDVVDVIKSVMDAKNVERLRCCGEIGPRNPMLLTTTLKDKSYSKLALKLAITLGFDTNKDFFKNPGIKRLISGYYARDKEDRDGISWMCEICQNSSPDERIVALRCGHLFHESCIGNPNLPRRACPVCETPVDVSLDRVYL